MPERFIPTPDLLAAAEARAAAWVTASVVSLAEAEVAAAEAASALLTVVASEAAALAGAADDDNAACTSPSPAPPPQPVITKELIARATPELACKKLNRIDRSRRRRESGDKSRRIASLFGIKTGSDECKKPSNAASIRVST